MAAIYHTVVGFVVVHAIQTSAAFGFSLYAKVVWMKPLLIPADQMQAARLMLKPGNQDKMTKTF